MYSNKVSTSKKFFGKSAILTAFLLAATLLPFALSATAATPGEGGYGGFSGPGPDLVTVQQAMQMRDDSRVTLKGNIIKSLGDEDYLFQDATGTIQVEIDHEVWRGQNIGPQDLVVISGEVDKDWNHTSVDVSTLVKQ